MFDFLRPEVFDLLVIVNVIIGVLIAGRRFVKDMRGPLPEDAPAWAHGTYSSPETSSSSEAS